MYKSKGKSRSIPQRNSEEPPCKASRKSSDSTIADNFVSLTESGAIHVAIPKKGTPKTPKAASKKGKLSSIQSNDVKPILPQGASATPAKWSGGATGQVMEESLQNMDAWIGSQKECGNSEQINLKSHLKPMITPYEAKDIVATAVDEIALEGLDGVTLEALWKRLSVSFRLALPLNEHFMQYIWHSIKLQPSIQYYYINPPRECLTVAKIDAIPDNATSIYPFVPINDESNNVLGSCSTYYTRQAIDVAPMSLDAAIKFGNSIVLVGDQELRTNAIFSPFADPLVLCCESQYYILEKIGRARYNGETTTGPNSVAILAKDSKTGFYYRTHLQQMKLIAKQSCRMKTDKKVNTTAGLLHLTRFFTEYKTERQVITEYIIKILKQKPSLRIEYSELRRIFGTDIWEKHLISKVIKSVEFRHFVKTDLVVPYRELYPNAKPSEWKQKQKDAEKSVRVLELANPALNEAFICKEENDDAEECESESDSESEGNVPFNVPVSQRIYNAIYDAGSDGISMRKMSEATMTDHHTTRTVLKNIKNDIDQKLTDSKRQHIMIYTSKATKKVKTEANPSRNISAAELSEADSFIANVLNVDVECLSKQPDLGNPGDEKPQDVRKNSAETVYQSINQLRRHKDSNTSQYYANQHEFAIAPVQVLPVPIVRSGARSKEKLSKLMSAILKPVPEKPYITSLHHQKYKCNESQLDKATENRIRGKITYSRQVALKSFAPFRCLLNSRYKMKSFARYAADWEDFSKENDSDSELEQYEELNSTLSLIDGMDGPDIEKVSERTKRIIIDNFQTEAVSMCEKFDAPTSSSRVEPPPLQAASVEPSVDNFFNVDMEVFMGPAPKIILINNDRQGVDTLLVLSSAPTDFNSKRSIVSNSVRVQSRKKLILNCVNKDKPIIDIVKLPALIYEVERAEGYNVNMDRKSLHRIFATLVMEGQLWVMKIILKYENIVRSKNFITVPNCDSSMLMQNFGDQFKNSFIIYAKKKVYERCVNNLGLKNSNKRRFKYSRYIGRIYGFQPKCTKMRILHEFIHYLIRGYTGLPVPREEAYNVFGQYCDHNSIESVMREATTVYHREVSWKMFVPPLPEHQNYTKDWALISDLLLRLPISLFVKLYNVSFIIPQLPSYLNHPIKKYFIVKNLPPEIKDALLVYRKYIFSIHETFCFLAYLGLLQFGSQKMNEKDQLFIYLNKHAVLYDTTSSNHGYHQVTPKSYPCKHYTFLTVTDLDLYWNDMYAMVINTNLGNRRSVVGQSIKLEYAHAKPLLTATLKPQTIESALENDVGYMPGDKLGVACTDSAIWMYVKRNWFWYNKVFKTSLQSSHKLTAVKRSSDTANMPKVGDMHKAKKQKFKLVQHKTQNMLKKAMFNLSRLSQKTKIIVRKVKPSKRMSSAKGRLRFDAIDRTISEKMGNSRAAFSTGEDKLILICWACSDYLTAYNKKRTIASAIIRDFIHRVLPNSTKTSLAYKRRSTQLRKANNLEEQSDVLNFKFSSDFFTEKYFSVIRDNLRRDSCTSVSDVNLNLAFIYLTYFIYKRWKANPESIVYPSKSPIMRDYLSDFSADQFQSMPDIDESFCADPQSDDDIVQDVIESVIHSSLSSQLPSASWPLQLLRVYQSFSEEMIRMSVLKLRDHQIISGRKLKDSQEGAIRMSGITYNLSFNYTFKQITNFPHCVFNEAHQLFAAMLERFDLLKINGVSIDKLEQGHGLCISEYMTKHRMNYVFDLPEDVITLNANMSDFTELIRELTQRYERLLKKTNEAEDKEDSEMVAQLESTLEAFFDSQRDDSPDNDTMPPKSDKSDRKQTDTYTKADRRLKAWKLSDMAFMLTKGLFPDLDDDERLEKLNEHFVIRYPTCRAHLDMNFKEDYTIIHECHYDIMVDSQEILSSVLSDVLINNYISGNVEANLDVKSRQVLSFIYGKGSLGASSGDLKELPNFQLETVEHLLAQRLVLRFGVCSFRFVHYSFRHNWTIRVPPNPETNSELEIENYRLRVVPWVRINGTLHKKLLEKWMSIVLSHCISNPFVPFNGLCARFNIIKPVDIYYLLELLHRLGCLQIWRIPSQEAEDIFTELGVQTQVPSSILDDFDEVYVETNTFAITKFGAFLNRNKTNFASAFEEEE